jgi:hypothetical protein
LVECTVVVPASLEKYSASSWVTPARQSLVVALVRMVSASSLPYSLVSCARSCTTSRQPMRAERTVASRDWNSGTWPMVPNSSR